MKYDTYTFFSPNSSHLVNLGSLDLGLPSPSKKFSSYSQIPELSGYSIRLKM